MNRRALTPAGATRGVRGAAGLLALALAFVGSPAAASMRPGVEIRVTGVTGPARAGVPVNAKVTFTAHEPVVLKQFAFAVRGVTVGSDAPPDSVVLPTGDSLVVNVSVVPTTEVDQFAIEVVANGVKLVRYRDWSQRYFDLLNYGATVGFDPQPDPPVVPAPAFSAEMRLPEARPLPVGERSLTGDPVLSLEQARRQASATVAAANETHHLHGRIRFKRKDGSYDYVDGASYTIWLDTAAFDVPVASGVTTPGGGYDATVVTPSSFGRRFYLVFTANNNWVHVLNNQEDDIPFKYRTEWFMGVAGGGDKQQDFLVSFGSDAAPMHILTMITREFRWVLDHTPYTYDDDIDDVDVAYPDSDWPHYAWPFTETINVPDQDWAWNGAMLIHEFGHHVNYELPIKMLQEDTEDGNCEPDGSPGRHCGWCAEDDLNVAVGEGFANFFEQIVSLDLEAQYGVPVLKRKDWESLPSACNEGGGNCGGCSPYATEGFFAALLTDLADNTPEESDPNARATEISVNGGAIDPEDRLALGFNAVLDLMVDYDISTVQDFVSAFEQRYGGSLDRADIFNTFANAGYWRDGAPPLPPSNVHSTDHAANTPSPDNSITFAWNAAADLGSGIQNYTVDLFKNGVHQIWQHPTSPTYTAADLGPGTYRIEVWAYDLQGNGSTDLYPKAVSPNYVVRDPYPTDLNERLPAGWTDGLVARCVAGATSGSCLDTPTLVGNQDSTWFNWAVENTGETPVDQSFRTRLLVDGEPLDSVSTITIITPPNSQTVINRGPHNIRGGRHTVEAWTDASEVIAESSESNNRWGRQFVWKPLALARNTAYTRPAPPDRLGGSNVISVPIGGTRFYNCDGFSYTHSNVVPLGSSVRWLAAELWGEHGGIKSGGANYDLMLHYPSDGSNDGFTDGLVTSSRGQWLTDAIITNNANAGQNQWNVGVVNTNGDDEDFHLRIDAAGTSVVGDSLVLSFAQDQMLVIRDLDVTSGNTGKLTAELRRLSGSGRFNLSWISSTASFRALAAADGMVQMDLNGFASLSFSASSVAHYALVAWRDPSAGTGPVTLSLKIWKKPADFAIVTPSGWYAPIVPRPLADATATTALAPGYLYGDDKPTYLNISRRNASDVASASNPVQVRLDDELAWSANYVGIPALTTYTNPNAAARNLAGGRHVLSLLLDPAGLVPELDELNNTYGEQWSWIPDTIAAGVPYWRRGQVGGPMAGWEYCLPDEYLSFDCDGTRLPAPAAGVNFAAVAAVARDTGDVDLALHDATNVSDAGFEAPLEDSNWSGGETELLVLNYGLAARKAYDVGMTRVSDDTASVVLEFAQGVVRSAAQNVHGPFTLATDHLVQVHEFALPPGRYALHLRNLSGNVDWAMALYDADRPFQDRSQGEELGWSYANGPGADEDFVYYTPVPVTVALVVYKTGSGETAKSGTYQIELNAGSAGAGDGGPAAATRLAAAYPNPFRGEAVVRYDLARSEDVTLEVYDLRGARVRTLARGRQDAGRWSAAWDGRDAAGNRVAAAVYLVRLAAGSYSGQQKVVRVE